MMENVDLSCPLLTLLPKRQRLDHPGHEASLSAKVQYFALRLQVARGHGCCYVLRPSMKREVAGSPYMYSSYL